jgi:preprotein translocase subunit SecD
MKANTRLFNLFLASTALAMLCGCQTESKNKEVSALRVHIEVNPNDAGTSQTISIPPRSDPVVLTIAKEPILTEASIIAAKMIRSPGGLGYAIAIQFDESSALMLEQYSAANPGKHFAVFGQWGEKVTDGRWLAAPIITHRIADGILSFNADLSSTNELGRLVLGLNNVAKKIRKGQLK